MKDNFKEIRDALDKITPGEWTASRTFSPTWAVHLGDRKLVLLGRAGLTGSMAGEIRGDLNESDATFIANSPEWVRFLLSEIERLQQERDEARRKAEEAWNENDAIERANHKLIEGLRKLAKTNAENLHEIRSWKENQSDPDATDLDWYNHTARNTLEKIGVTVE